VASRLKVARHLICGLVSYSQIKKEIAQTVLFLGFMPTVLLLCLGTVCSSLLEGLMIYDKFFINGI
jgi:hypothetical protein